MLVSEPRRTNKSDCHKKIDVNYGIVIRLFVDVAKLNIADEMGNKKSNRSAIIFKYCKIKWLIVK